jgi:hypothetical protein
VDGLISFIANAIKIRKIDCTVTKYQVIKFS